MRDQGWPSGVARRVAARESTGLTSDILQDEEEQKTVPGTVFPTNDQQGAHRPVNRRPIGRSDRRPRGAPLAGGELARGGAAFRLAQPSRASV
jgi:hypothetical protein